MFTGKLKNKYEPNTAESNKQLHVAYIDIWRQMQCPTLKLQRTKYIPALVKTYRNRTTCTYLYILSIMQFTSRIYPMHHKLRICLQYKFLGAKLAN